MLLDSILSDSCLQNIFVGQVGRLVSVRWEFSLCGFVEPTIGLKYCYCLIYSFH